MCSGRPWAPCAPLYRPNRTWQTSIEPRKRGGGPREPSASPEARTHFGRGRSVLLPTLPAGHARLLDLLGQHGAAHLPLQVPAVSAGGGGGGGNAAPPPRVLAHPAGPSTVLTHPCDPLPAGRRTRGAWRGGSCSRRAPGAPGVQGCSRACHAPPPCGICAESGRPTGQRWPSAARRCFPCHAWTVMQRSRVAARRLAAAARSARSAAAPAPPPPPPPPVRLPPPVPHPAAKRAHSHAFGLPLALKGLLCQLLTLPPRRCPAHTAGRRRTASFATSGCPTGSTR